VSNITPYNRFTIYLLAVTQPLYSLTQNNVSNKNHSNKSITHLQAKKQKHCFKNVTSDVVFVYSNSRDIARHLEYFTVDDISHTKENETL